MKSIVICDLDGTLIDSREDLTDAVNLMLAEYGLPSLSVETVTGYIGNGARKLVERAARGRIADLDGAVQKLKRHYGGNMVCKTRLYPTVKEGLETIRGLGYRLAVISNKPSEACVRILGHFGVAPLFDLILGGSDRFRLKPDPEVIFHAMAETGSGKDGSWIIGDSDVDLETGRNAGIKCCYAEYGFKPVDGGMFDLSVAKFADFAEHLVSNSGTRI